MGKSSAVLLVSLLLAASCYVVCLPASAGSKTIVVPDDFATLEAAVYQASAGDTIYVRSGQHKISNDTLVINKTLSIIGEDAEATFLIGPGYGYEFFPGSTSTKEDNFTLKSVEIIPANFIVPPKVALQVNADNFQISQVTIEKCDVGITVYGNRTTVTRMKMPSASITGSHSVVSDNFIVSISVKGDHQKLTRNYGSISLDGSYSLVAENKAEGDMHLTGFFNVIAGNSFSTIYMEHANSNIICNNSLKCLWVGFYGYTCSNNIVCKNRLTGPGIWGILVGAGSYNVFHDNLISNYGGEYDGYGIAIGGYGLIAEHNMFYRNIFVSNNRHVSTNWEVLGAGNLWDNGKEGNYWDDYDGVDADGNGIGDIPYIVRGVIWDEAARGHVSFVFGQDNYPLMSFFDIDSIPMELPDLALILLNPALEHELIPFALPNSTPEPTPQSQWLGLSSAAWVAVAVSLVVVVGVGISLYLKKVKKTVNYI